MYLSTMYLSHHSKTVISADEKVAELIGQRDKLDAQLAAEREKVRVLRDVMKFIANDDNYMEQYFDPCQLASSALAATEETK